MRRLLCLLAGLLPAFSTSGLDLKLPVLQTPGGVYSNVTVTTITATDIFFLHAHGGGNAKLSALSPDLRRQFGYDPLKAEAAQKAQWEANSTYRANALQSHANLSRITATNDVVEIPRPEIHAKSFLGQPPPDLVVSKWLTAAPDANGKFVLVFFWTTTCEPCRELIPDLNRYHQVFQNQLMVMGLSEESEDVFREWALDKARKPLNIEFYSAVDTVARTKKAMEVRGIPHCFILDPKGIVRYEGHPAFINESVLRTIFERYEK